MNDCIIEIYSKGLYSSWCYHKPTRTLFDCGEGFASYQGNYMYGVERVMISHGHGDHVLGLPSMIGCRNSGRGDRKKPLDIYFPYGDKLVEGVRDFIQARSDRHLRYDVNWHPIAPGYTLDLTPKVYITAHANEHQKGGKFTLGYKINERRKHLMDAYVGQDIGALVRKGINKDDLMVSYVANTFAYALDAYYADHNLIAGAEIGVMDCTFLRKDDRDDMTHYTLEEAVDDFVGAKGKKLIAAHFSPRYLFPEIKAVVAKMSEKYNIPIVPVFHNQVTNV